MRGCCVLFFLAVAASAQEDTGDRVAFEKVCGACHKSSMASDLKTESEWIETVDNMISNGAKGTDEQFDRVMRYLARNLTLVNVNVAAAREIAPVLGVSEKTAEAIVEYRSRHGSFTKLDDLGKVPGVALAQLEIRKHKIAFR